MILHVLKHPAPDTLARVTCHSGDEPAIPAGWERMTKEECAAWQKAQLDGGWKPVAAQPAPAERLLVAKDTVVRRIRAAGKLGEMRQLIAGMTPNDQFEFAHLTQLDPADARLRAGITQLGLNPDEVLAP